MIVSYIKLKNWRNFREVEVPLTNRVFLAGPNASGKSNFLDVFRFLRDIVKQGGGLQQAIDNRGGISKIRCLAARQDPDIEIEVHLSNGNDKHPLWRYAISVKQQPRGSRFPYLLYEKVWKNEELILNRPDPHDREDEKRLTQTHLEQIIANKDYRDIADYFNSVLYLHLIPQLLRTPEAFKGTDIPDDPFGKNFLDKVAKASKRTRDSRLRKIEEALKKAVPQLKNLSLAKDESGTPHLEAVYEHWRPQGAKQWEDQFSDGTLRLIGLFWSLLEGESLLLLEEPELSLNAAITRHLSAIIYRLQKTKNRQVILSTHSADILSDKGIGGEEVLMFNPSHEGTLVKVSSQNREVRALLEEGFSVGEVVLPLTEPREIQENGYFPFMHES